MRSSLTIAAAGAWLYLAGTVAPAVAAPADAGNAAPASSDRCLPTVEVEGEASLAEAFVQALTARGLRIDGQAGCRLRVRVSHDGEGFRIEVEDPYGRRSTRQVHTLAIGALLVESWTRIEVRPPEMPSEAAAAQIASPVPADAAIKATGTDATPAVATSGAANDPPAAPDGSPSAVAPPASPSEPEGARKTTVSAAPLRFSMGAGPAVSSDGSSWLGGALRAAKPAGSFRLGGGLQLEVDPGWTGASAEARSARAMLDAVVRIEYRLPMGRWDLMPGVMAGVGLLRAWPWDRAGDGGERPEDGDEPLDDGERMRDENTIGMRLGGQLVVRRPLRPGLAFVSELALEATPFQRTFLHKDEAPTLPGFPEGMVRMAVGLELGGP